MKNRIILVFIFIFLVSCTKNEKKFVNILMKAQEGHKDFIIKKSKIILTNKSLISLKNYSDSIDIGLELFQKLMKKKSFIKRAKKYIKRSDNKYLICSKLFFTHTQFQIIKKQCEHGHFNICPLSFNKYLIKKKIIIEKIKFLLGEDFQNTDCQEYLRLES